MDDERGLMVFILFFAGLVLAAFGLANQDQITPLVAEAQAGATIGTNTVMALEKGASIGLKLLVGAVVAGVAAAVFSEAKKAYKAWKRNSQMRRWQGGPNAQWKTKVPAEPKLRREDLMLLALSGRYPGGLGNRPRIGRTRTEPSEDELDIEM